MKTARQLVDEAMALVRTLTPAEARTLHDEGRALFVDLRDLRELEAEGLIPGACHAPRGLLEFLVDPASPFHDDTFAAGRPLVLYCAIGWRSALAARTLQEMGFAEVSHVGGGFAAWRAAGAPVVGGGVAAGAARPGSEEAGGPA